MKYIAKPMDTKVIAYCKCTCDNGNGFCSCDAAGGYHNGATVK